MFADSDLEMFLEYFKNKIDAPYPDEVGRIIDTLEDCLRSLEQVKAVRKANAKKSKKEHTSYEKY